MKYLSFLFLFLMLTTSCETYTEEQKASFNEEVETYVKERNIDSKVTDTGLHYAIEEVGSGRMIKITDKVSVIYTGYLTDGTVFDSTGQEPRTFKLKETILGWREGFSFFKKGGKGMLIVPPQLGYGDNKKSGIPENSILIFKFHIVDVN